MKLRIPKTEIGRMLAVIVIVQILLLASLFYKIAHEMRCPAGEGTPHHIGGVTVCVKEKRDHLG